MRPTRLEAYPDAAPALGALRQAGLALGAISNMGQDLPLVLEDIGVSAYLNVVVASGGAGHLEHFYSALTEGGASAVLAASLFHFGQYKIAEVKDYLRARGVVVR